MTAAVWTTFEPDRRSEAARWTAAAAMVLLAHAAVITPYMLLERPDSSMQAEQPAITIDFAPPEVVPEPAPPVEEQKPEEVPPPPVEAATPPPEEVTPEPEPPPPPKPDELTIPEEKPVPPPPPIEKPKVTQPKKPPPPKPVRQAALPPTAPNAGTPSVGSSSAKAEWRGSLRAQIMRNQQHAGEAGTVMVSCTLDRSGRVLSRHVAQSSGHPVLDQAALATIDRAQPLPAPPADISSAELRLNIPIRFSVN
jgi:protein TonB